MISIVLLCMELCIWLLLAACINNDGVDLALDMLYGSNPSCRYSLAIHLEFFFIVYASIFLQHKKIYVYV